MYKHPYFNVPINVVIKFDSPKGNTILQKSTVSTSCAEIYMWSMVKLSEGISSLLNYALNWLRFVFNNNIPSPT